MSDDLGLELLMNPKKKSSDAMSVISSLSGKDRRHSQQSFDQLSEQSSVKSVEIKPHVIDVRTYTQGGLVNDGNHDFDVESGDMDDEDDLDDDLDNNLDNEVEEQVRPTIFQTHGPKTTRRFQDNRPHVNEDAMSDASQSIAQSDYDERPKMHHNQSRNHLSEEEIINSKRELLYKFDRLEKKGMKLPKKFTMSSSLEEMRTEFERIRHDRDIDNSVQFQRKAMVTIVSGIELMNTWFNGPAKLSGWSDCINENIDEYDDVFEELHEKYKGKAKMAPEFKLLLMVGGSGLMYHMTNNIAKSGQTPGLDQVLKENPELAKQFAAATAKTYANQQQQSNPLMSGFGGMLSSFMGGGGLGNIMSSMMGGMMGGGGSSAQAHVPVAPQYAPASTTMKGPSNVDDILRDLDNDRIEVMSTLTGSELTEFADDASINNLLMNRRGKRGGGNKRTLDI